MTRLTFALMTACALAVLAGCSKEEPPAEEEQPPAPEPAEAQPSKQVKWELPWKEKDKEPPPPPDAKSGEPRKSPEELQKEKIIALIEEYKGMKEELKKLQKKGSGGSVSFTGLGENSGMSERRELRQQQKKLTVDIKKMRYKIEGEKMKLRQMLKTKM